MRSVQTVVIGAFKVVIELEIKRRDNDKKVKLEKRVERAHALVIVGEMFQKVCATLESPLLQQHRHANW